SGPRRRNLLVVALRAREVGVPRPGTPRCVAIRLALGSRARRKGTLSATRQVRTPGIGAASLCRVRRERQRGSPVNRRPVRYVLVLRSYRSRGRASFVGSLS